MIKMHRVFLWTTCFLVLTSSSCLARSVRDFYCHLFVPCFTCSLFYGFLDALNDGGSAVFVFLFSNLSTLLGSLTLLLIVRCGFKMINPFGPPDAPGSALMALLKPLIGIALFTILANVPTVVTATTNTVLEASLASGVALMNSQGSTVSLATQICPAAPPYAPPSPAFAQGSIIDPSATNQMLTLLGNVESTFSIVAAVGVGTLMNTGNLISDWVSGKLATDLNNVIGGLVLVVVGSALTMLVPLFMMETAVRVFITVAFSPLLIVFLYWERTRENAISIFSQLPLVFFKSLIYAMMSIAAARMLSLALATDADGTTLSAEIIQDRVHAGIVDRSFWLLLATAILNFAMFAKVPTIAAQFISTAASPGLSAGASVLAGTIGGKAAGGAAGGARALAGMALGPVGGLAGAAWSVASSPVGKVLERMKPKK
jgi:hypothetical protein